MITTIEDAKDFLYNQKKLKKREDLSRIKNCIDLLNIKTNYEIIHIAGTNGKGSTACYIKKMLELKGLKVGFFVSPFVIEFNERIQINDEYVSDAEIISSVNILKDFSMEYFNKYNDSIPFFELTLLMALMHFEKNKIDYAIIECGLGGLLDSTNCLDTAIQVITNIGYDHMAQLGNTLEEIAYHKLGITRKNKPCFTCIDDDIKPYFLKYAKENDIDIHYVKNDVSNIIIGNMVSFDYKNESYKTKLNATYQAYNASLAIEVIKYIFNDYPKSMIDEALNQAYWPGRAEEIIPDVIIDGAHNISAMEALVASLSQRYLNKTFKFVFFALHDKDIKEMLKCLDKVSSFYYFTTINDKRTTDINLFSTLTKKPFELIDDYENALDKAIKEKKCDEILIITGSLHFISAVRKYLKGE